MSVLKRLRRMLGGSVLPRPSFRLAPRDPRAQRVDAVIAKADRVLAQRARIDAELDRLERVIREQRA